MANAVQWAKALGKLPDVPLGKLSEAAVERSVADEVAQTTCGCVDQQDPEIASLNPDNAGDVVALNEALQFDEADGMSLESALSFCEDLIRLHRQAPPPGAEEAGSGSFPSGCWPEHYSSDHSALLYVERATFSTNWKRQLDESEWEDLVKLRVYSSQFTDGCPFHFTNVAEAKQVFRYTYPAMARDAGAQLGDQMDMLDIIFMLVSEAYRVVGCPIVRVYDGTNGVHNIHVRGKDMPGGLRGYAFFNSRECRSHVNQFLDNLGRVPFVDQLSLAIHETGHNMNLQHQFPGQQGHKEPLSYMWDFWTAQGFSTGSSPYELPVAPSRAVLQRYFDWQTHIPPSLEKPTVPVPPQPPTGPIPEKLGELRSDANAPIRGELTLYGTFNGELYYCRPKPGSPGIYEVVRSPE